MEQDWSKDEALLPVKEAIADAVFIGRIEGWRSWRHTAAVYHALTVMPPDMLVWQFRELLIQAGCPDRPFPDDVR